MHIMENEEEEEVVDYSHSEFPDTAQPSEQQEQQQNNSKSVLYKRPIFIITVIFSLVCLIVSVVLIIVSSGPEKPTTKIGSPQAASQETTSSFDLRLTKLTRHVTPKMIGIIVVSGVVAIGSIVAVLLVYFLVVLPAEQSDPIMTPEEIINQLAPPPPPPPPPQKPSDYLEIPVNDDTREEVDVLLALKLIGALVAVTFIPFVVIGKHEKFFPTNICFTLAFSRIEAIITVVAFLIPAITGTYAGAASTAATVLLVYLLDAIYYRTPYPYESAVPLGVMVVCGASSAVLSAIVDYRLVMFPFAVIPAFIAGRAAGLRNPNGTSHPLLE